jgi:hypothetical protein
MIEWPGRKTRLFAFVALSVCGSQRPVGDRYDFSFAGHHWSDDFLLPDRACHFRRAAMLLPASSFLASACCSCFAANICSVNDSAPYVAHLPEPTGWVLLRCGYLRAALVMLFINMLVTTYVLPPALGLFAAGNLAGRAIWWYVNRSRSLDPPAPTGGTGDGARRRFGQKQ